MSRRIPILLFVVLALVLSGARPAAAQDGDGATLESEGEGPSIRASGWVQRDDDVVLVEPDGTGRGHPLTHVVVSRRGGALRRVVLGRQQAFGEEAGSGYPLLGEFKDGRLTGAITAAWRPSDGGPVVTLDTAAETWEVVEHGDTSVTLRLRSGDLVFERTWTWLPEVYHLETGLTVRNEGDARVDVSVWVQGPAGLYRENVTGRFTEWGFPQAVVTAGMPGRDIGWLEEHDEGDAEDREDRAFDMEGDPIRAWGTATQFFASAFLVREGTRNDVHSVEARSFTVTGPDGDDTTYLQTVARLGVPGQNGPASGVRLEAGEDQAWSLLLYVGPKQERVLANYQWWGLEHLVDYGAFIGPFSRLLLMMLGAIQFVVRDWGVAIVLLTILVRLALHPLSRKAQFSMHALKRLQPKIKKLQEKYKDDRERLTREQMALWREHGVNPVGGCLPLFFQMPILFGLYRALLFSFDLRREGFLPAITWINDLSRPDRLIVWDTPLPIMGWTSLNLLAVLMIIVWYLQQKTMPQPADPQMAAQQKIFKWIPIIIGIFMYDMPSGLVLYWLTSTGIGLMEQKYIRHLLRKQGFDVDGTGAEDKPEAEPAGA